MGSRFSAPVQTSPGVHPASYTMGTGSFPGVKWPERRVDHPLPSSAVVEERVELYICSTSSPYGLLYGEFYLCLYLTLPYANYFFICSSYSAFLLSLSCETQLSQTVQIDSGCMYDEAAFLGAERKERPCIIQCCTAYCQSP